MNRQGLLIDYGGVLTGDVFAAFQSFTEAEGLPADQVARLLRADPQSRQLLGDLERGALDPADFERGFAARLGVQPDGLIQRLLGGVELDHAMHDAVRAARRQGVRTVLVSNSWGPDGYDGAELDGLFDALVISGRVGVRKPSRAIYRLAAEAAGLDAAQCVFVDDLAVNLVPARELGMATVEHRATATTVAELEALLGVSLS
jgi:epoxide hydrolase-like predicted phosphatase